MRVMLDTNILVSAFIFKSKKLNELIFKLSREHEIVICTYTISELENLIDTKFNVDLKELEEFLKNFQFELVHSPTNVKRKLFNIRDNDDYIILHTAVISDVDVFITGDKDFEDVWLDTPMIEILGGEGTIEKRIPAMFRMYMNYGIDMRKVPIVIYPTLHYQNGGLEINGDGFTKEIPNLLVAGEAAGGIHGRNRLMGNSLLDVIVFGRNAGKKAAAKCKNVELGEMNLDHIYKYAEELDKAGVHTDKVSPLLLPKYARHEQR